MNFLNTVAVFGIFFTFNLTAFAHSPTDIKIEFIGSPKILTAVITHSVHEPNAHYIFKVVIAVNGQKVRTLTFQKQEDLSKQTITFPVPEAKSGDRLSVEAYCNLSGKLEKEIEVP